MGSHRADRRTLRPDETPVVIHVSRSSRKASRDAARTTTQAASTAGKRRATAPRRPISRFLPAAPLVLGTSTVAAAAVAAVLVGPGSSTSAAALQLAAADSFSGTDAFNFAGNDSRSIALSRDSERQAVKQSAAAELKAAAQRESARRNATVANLARSAELRADQIARNLWVIPTQGYRLTARFGESSGLWSRLHTGLDFAAPSGTPIFAVAGGEIISSGYDGAYGYKTVQRLADGTEIWYCHQSSSNVTPGQRVTQGAQIGRVGSTGNVTGPHLHLEVRPAGADPVDPYPALLEHGVTP